MADDLATEKGNNSTLEGEKAALANDADKAKKDLEAAKETITKTETEITTLKGKLPIMLSINYVNHTDVISEM